MAGQENQGDLQGLFWGLASGISNTWRISVHTGMYRHILVHGGTYASFGMALPTSLNLHVLFSKVGTRTYQYVLVCTKTVYHGICKYIAVHSGICQYEILSIKYILVHTASGICRSWIFMEYPLNMVWSAIFQTYSEIRPTYEKPYHMSCICLVYL